MTPDERLRRVFADVFGVAREDVDYHTSPETIEAWDSVGHVNLVLALEGEFQVRFEAEEIPELVSYGLIMDRLATLEPSPSDG